ncbi:MAG: hypothetical protein AB1798_13495, partial [Spirochaetota bacterium]
IRTLDIDPVIRLMYRCGYYLITDVTGDTVVVKKTADKAAQWIEDVGPSAFSFIYPFHLPQAETLFFNEIDASSQIDFMIDLTIPFARLKERATTYNLDDFSICVAAINDLIQLKEDRSDKTDADYADLAFLKGL